MTLFNLEELYNIKSEKIKSKITIYNRILGKIHSRIRNVANNSLESFCFYAIQDLYLGIPNYNKKECIKYLFKKLTDNGFKVRYTHPNLFYISWDHINKDKPVKNINNDKKIEEPLVKKIKDINSYKPNGNFIYNDQLSSLKYKSNNLFNN